MLQSRSSLILCVQLLSRLPPVGWLFTEACVCYDGSPPGKNGAAHEGQAITASMLSGDVDRRILLAFTRLFARGRNWPAHSLLIK